MPHRRPLSRAFYRLTGIPEPADPEPAIAAFTRFLAERPTDRPPPSRTGGRIRLIDEPGPLRRQP